MNHKNLCNAAHKSINGLYALLIGTDESTGVMLAFLQKLCLSHLEHLVTTLQMPSGKLAQ